MIHLPDLTRYPGIDQAQIQWLLSQGARAQALASLMPLRMAKGIVARDGRFEEDDQGQGFIVFPEAEDVVFWQPRHGDIGTWTGRAFALGEAAIDDPATYSFDCNLNLLPDPLEWLRCGCDGCVVLDWTRAWSRLAEVPRVAVHERLFHARRRYLDAPKGPEIFILSERRAAA